MHPSPSPALLCHGRGLLLAALALAGTLPGCISYLVEPVSELHRRGGIAVADHRVHGERCEAEWLTHVLRLPPTDTADITPSKADAAADGCCSGMTESALGVNRAARMTTDASLGERFFWYAPDRVMDLLDIVSLDVHFASPLSLYANVHVTRALQLGLGGRRTIGYGWHEGRSLGFQALVQRQLAVMAWSSESLVAYRYGTSPDRSTGLWMQGLQSPFDPAYQEFRDYYACGAALTVPFLGLEVGLHPAQAVDFLLGFTTFDLLGDDHATSRGLRLSEKDEALARRIGPSTFEALSRHGRDGD